MYENRYGTLLTCNAKIFSILRKYVTMLDVYIALGLGPKLRNLYIQ